MTTPIYRFNELSSGAWDKESSINENSLLADGLLSTVPASRILVNTPPTAPGVGHLYVIGTSPTGIWAGNQNAIAVYTINGWLFVSPTENQKVITDTGQLYRYATGVWNTLALGSGETNTASTLGTGTGVFAQKSGVDLQFKSLKAGANTTITSTSTEVTIASTASGVVNTTDSNSIDFSGDGTVTTPLTASLKLDPTSTASVSITSQGLKVDSSANATTYSSFETVSSNKTLTNADHEKTLLVENTIALTLPNSTTVTQNIRVNVRLNSTGTVTFTPGSGATRQPSSGSLSFVNNSVYCEFNSATNTWYLTGALT